MFFNNFYQWNLNNRLIVSAGRKTDSVHYDSICSTIFSLPAAFYFVFYYYTSWERVSVLKKIYCSHRKVLSPKKQPHLHLQFFLNPEMHWICWHSGRFSVVCKVSKFKKSKSSLRLNGGEGFFIFSSIFFVLCIR